MSDTLAIRSNTVTRLDAPQLDFILLDGSYSMMEKWWDMLGALDAYLDTLKANHVDSHLLLHVFDSNNLELVARDCHIKDHQNFTSDPIGSDWGGTPLWDAIVIMGRNIRDLNPSKCAVTIVTDGEATSSRFADITQARSVLDWLRAQGFQVTFIGCDFNNDRQARALGANESNSIGVARQHLLAAAKTYAEKRTRNARTGDDINFTGDEKQQFGGYLGHSGAK